MSSGELSRGQKRRIALFEFYGAHLAAFSADHLMLEVDDDAGESVFIPPSPDLYICPLCLRVFQRGALNDLAAPCLLTVEHVPPTRVAYGVRKSRLLTCKGCNNRLGAQAESELEAALALRDLRPGHRDGHRECILRTGTAAVQAHLKIGEDRALGFEVVGDASADGREAFFNAPRGKFRFTVSLRAPRTTSTEAAIIKAAYLLAFTSFGYGWMFSSPALREIRARIASPRSTSPIDNGVVQLDVLPDGLTSPSISIVHAPSCLRSVLVTLTLQRKNGDPRVVGMFFPGPDTSTLELYDALANRGSIREQIQGAVVVAPAPGAQVPIHNPAHRHDLYLAWQHLCG
jgi:hypothetical protein